MARRPGQESGHFDSPSTTWDRYVALLVSGAGGWAALADALIHKSRRAGGPTDRAIVEKGLRRLATRGHRSGGRYGQLLIRFFGAFKIPDGGHARDLVAARFDVEHAVGAGEGKTETGAAHGIVDDVARRAGPEHIVAERDQVEFVGL